MPPSRAPQPPFGDLLISNYAYARLRLSAPAGAPLSRATLTYWLR